MALSADPFLLFPRQIEKADIVQLAKGAGKKETILKSDVDVIIKRKTGTEPISSNVGGERTETYHLHFRTSDFTDFESIQMLVDLVVRTVSGRSYKLIGVSRGDDMDAGSTVFISATAQPWARKTL